MELQNSRVSFHESSNNVIFDQCCTTWWEQFTLLLRRGFKERKYEQFPVHIICQVLALSFFAGLLWWKSRADQMQNLVGLLFYYTQFCGFFPMAQSIFTFPRDRGMIIKERSSYMYRLSSYFIASNVVDLPFQLALPTVFVTITYWMSGLKTNASIFFQTLAVAILYALVSQGIGLAISALLMNNQRMAVTVGAVVMTLFVIVNGYFLQNVPPFVSWIMHISHSYYSFKLLLGSQFKDDNTYMCGPNVTCSVGNFPVIKHVGLGNKGFSIVALVAMLVGYRLIAYFALMVGMKHN